MKTWNVAVVRDKGLVHIGQVQEDSEKLARLAALSKYGLTDEDLAVDAMPTVWPAILPADDFLVTEA